MSKILKPMLGTSIDREVLIAYLKTKSLLASFKLDGIRALVRDGVVLSRSLKPIPNRHVQELFGNDFHEGFDGELIVGEPNVHDVFRTTTSGVMSEDGQPPVKFYVFDLWNMPTTPFHDRIARVSQRAREAFITPVAQYEVNTIDDVDTTLNNALGQGFEGLVLRNPLGLYKYGRSTAREAGLLKLKPYVDAEAEVIGAVELMHNENEAFTNELGRTARSYSKAGKVPGNMLGALVCRTPEGVEFEIGTGFALAERQDLWVNRQSLVGRLVKYKSLIIGVKDKPRHAVFLGFRDRRDT